MQHSTPGEFDENPEQLPARSEERRAPLTIARSNQQLSLELRPAVDGGDDEEGINLFHYWRILVKRRWTVLSVLAMVLVISLVNTLLTTPIYRAYATVQVESTSTRSRQVGGSSSLAEDSFENDFQQTQIQLLKSRSMAKRAVTAMGLAQSGEMDRLWPGSSWEKIKSLFSGAPAKSDDAKPRTGAPVGKKLEEQINALAGSFQGGVTVFPVQDSELVQVNYDSPSPTFSQRAVNALVEAYIASDIERRFDTSSYSKTYLEDRLQQLKLKLEDSERKLVEFAQEEQIVSSGETSGASLLEQNLNAMNGAYSTAKQNRIRAESRWRQSQGLSGSGLWQLAAVPSGTGNNGAADNSSVIKNLQESRSHMLIQYQDKLRLFKPDYPEMQQLKGQIDEVDGQIKTEEGNIRAGIRADYESALQEETVLGAQLAQMRNDVLDLQKRSIQYNIYRRDVDTNRQLYDALLQRYKDLDVVGGVNANNISFVDRAEPGYKVLPNVRHDLIQATLAGLMLGMLLAFAFEYIDDTIKRPEDIEKLLGIPVLGAIPKLKPPQTVAGAMSDARSGFSEAYRSLRTALQFATDRGVPRTLLITSATASEGKSTTALALGQYFAQLGKRVLIVDCDLRNPSLHRTLNVDNNQGLSNYLSGAGRPDLIRPTQVPGLSYLPTGPLPPNPAELLVGSKMMSVLTVAAEKFDLLILDGPPILGLADAPILANLAQGTLMIVHAEETRVGIAKSAIKRLYAARAHIVGGLLTHYQPEHSGTTYAYGRYGHYTYGSGQTQLTRK